MDDPTVAEFVDKAISWEIAARDLYVSLAGAFPSHPSVVEVWERLAADESRHAAILRKTRDDLSQRSLSERLKAEEIALIESVEEELERAGSVEMVTLDDAYEIAHAIESSEVNTVFRLVVSRLGSAAAHALLEAQFDEHVGRLDLLAAEFDRPARKRIRLEA